MVNYSWNAMVSFSTGSGTTPVAPPATMPLPTALSLKQFMKWSVDDQIAYIEAKGTGSPKKVTIGDPGQVGDPGYPKPTFTLGYTLSTPPTLDFSDLVAADINPDDFVTWTRDNQIGFIAEFGNAGVVSLGGPINGAIARVLPSGVLEMIAAGVLHPTAGEPIPYHHLSGSAGGTPSTVVSTSAEWLFPSLDGANHKLPVSERPAQFSFDPTTATDAEKTAFLKDFVKWHSAYQLEYIKTHGTDLNVGSIVVKQLDIEVTSPEARLSAVVSPDDPTKHFIVQALDKAAVARMTKSEQDVVAATDAFSDIASGLGLALVGSTSLRAFGANMNGGTLTLNVAANTAVTPAGYIDELIHAVNNTTAPDKGNIVMPEEARTAFVSQLNILKEQLANSAIVSKDDIKKKVDELRERFNRLFAFFDVRVPVPVTAYLDGDVDDHDSPITTYTDVITADGDLTSINRGYAVFLAQEQRIAELAEARMKLVRDNGMLNGKNLDVPYLVYKFQSLYNLSLEAQVVAETEEVNQQNALLKTYAAIQDIVNQTLAKFTKADDTKKRVLGLGANDYDSLSQTQKYTIAMFEDILGARQKHPLEVLNGISRPLSEFYAQSGDYRDWADPADGDGDGDTTDKDVLVHYHYDLAENSHTQWSTIGTRLSESVTIINQNSQIQMNDINSMDKERNRHFELANNALAKMADIIANIARS